MRWSDRWRNKYIKRKWVKSELGKVLKSHKLEEEKYSVIGLEEEYLKEKKNKKMEGHKQ